MQIAQITDNNTDFSRVIIKNNLPFCNNHGYMNKVSVFSPEGNLPYLNRDRVWIKDPISGLHRPRQIGGYWRCLELSCRAGCQQLSE